ncbi:hypothetical protein SAMN05428950_102561 [Sphingomonas sp. OV641]|nr:hypothetical protein SAMN05428950_102561 [Sphingomonas sp. OV641]
MIRSAFAAFGAIIGASALLAYVDVAATVV